MSQSVDIHMGSDLAKRQAWPSSSAVIQDDPARPTHPAAFIGNPAPLGLLAFGMTTCKDREKCAVGTAALHPNIVRGFHLHKCLCAETSDVTSSAAHVAALVHVSVAMYSPCASHVNKTTNQPAAA